MDKEDAQKQCLQWKKDIDNKNKKLGFAPNPRYFEMKKKMEDFTDKVLEKIVKPKFKVFSITKQTVFDQKKYPIFFIRDRQIFEENKKLEWRYFGSLFNIINEKITYKTTTSYIPERFLQEF